MKTTVVVGLFVLVVCLNNPANSAQFRGKTDDCQKRPEGFGRLCHRFLCDDKTGLFVVHTCGVSAISCEEGKEQDYHTEDLTKPYPECCAEPYCRDA